MGLRTAARLGALGLLVTTAAACWPQPGAGPGNTNHNPGETSLTVANVDTLEEVWSAPGALDAVSHGTVVAELDAGSPTRTTVAYRAADGAERWRHRLAADGATMSLRMHPTVVAGDEVWATRASQVPLPGACDAGLTRLEIATGAVVAETDGEGVTELVPFRDQVVTQAMPLTADCTWGVSSGVRVLDAASGAVDWTDSAMWPTIVNRVIIADGIVLADATGELVGWDATACDADPTCEPAWRLPLDGWQVTGMADGGRGRALVTAQQGAGHRMMVVDLATGALTAAAPLDGAPNSLAVADDTAYVVLSSPDGVENNLHALDVASCAAGACTSRWSADLGGDGATLVSGGGVLYAGAYDGTVDAYDAAGCGATTCAPVAEVPVPGPVGNMIVAGGQLYVTVYGEIHAFAPTEPAAPA